MLRKRGGNAEGFHVCDGCKMLLIVTSQSYGDMSSKTRNLNHLKRYTRRNEDEISIINKEISADEIFKLFSKKNIIN
jgi:hypothetical protein